MTEKTVYRGFAVLAKLSERDLEPGDWTEAARTETEQEAHAIARLAVQAFMQRTRLRDRHPRPDDAT